MKRKLAQALAAVAVLGAAGEPAAAAVTRMEVKAVRPAFGGQSFGPTGAYEVVDAIAHFEIDPDLPANAVIANLQRAPRNARGMVEFDADLTILRPAEAGRGNRTLFYEPVNRGNILSLGAFNGGGRGAPLTDAAAAGDGFLMRQGYTLVFGGWQPEYPLADAPAMAVGGGSRLPRAPGRLAARLPVARAADGSSITARIFASGGPNASGESGVLYLTYPAADVNDRSAYVRSATTGEPVKDASWRYLDEWRVRITRPAGARGAVDFVYTAKDPVVYGLALVAMRDVVSFLRFQTVGSPLKAPIRHTIGYGASQTGRTLKNVIHHFNDDERGRRVFDGAHIHISGASLNSQNEVFGQPGLKGGEPFPYTYATLFDPLSRRTDGWLRRCSGTGVCPKIIHTDSDAELSLAGSLVYTDTSGRDVKAPDNVRVYLLASTQHSPDAAPTRGACANLSNPLPYREPMRALLTALGEWVANGRTPPESRHPRAADGTLVSLAEARRSFPAVPGMAFSEDFPPMHVLDPASGEPVRGLAYPVFRPKTDADGNTVAGVRHPELQAPLGTYTGWNPRPAAAGGGSCPATGSYAPFARTRAERAAAGDPRLSIEERYPSEAAYVAAIRRASADLVAQRLMLRSDADALVQAAPDRYRRAMATGGR